MIDNVDVTGLSPQQIIEQGLSYIPEERNRDGLIQEFNISENLILRENNKPPFTQRGFLDFKLIAERSREMVERFAREGAALRQLD